MSKKYIVAHQNELCPNIYLELIHIVVARKKICCSFLLAGLYFHRFVHFGFVSIYIQLALFASDTAHLIFIQIRACKIKSLSKTSKKVYSVFLDKMASAPSKCCYIQISLKALLASKILFYLTVKSLLN